MWKLNICLWIQHSCIALSSVFSLFLLQTHTATVIWPSAMETWIWFQLWSWHQQRMQIFTTQKLRSLFMLRMLLAQDNCPLWASLPVQLLFSQVSSLSSLWNTVRWDSFTTLSVHLISSEPKWEKINPLQPSARPLSYLNDFLCPTFTSLCPHPVFTQAPLQFSTQQAWHQLSILFATSPCYIQRKK